MFFLFTLTVALQHGCMSRPARTVAFCLRKTLPIIARAVRQS
jgi:hypothetical protein